MIGRPGDFNRGDDILLASIPALRYTFCMMISTNNIANWWWAR